MHGRLLPGYSPEDLISELVAISGGELELEVIRHDPGPSEPDMALFETLKDILRAVDSDGEPVPILLPGLPMPGFSPGWVYRRMATC